VIFKSLAGKAPPAGGLLPALALSCVLHVLLLWPDALPRAAQQAGLPLTATLRAAAVPDRIVATAMPVPAEKAMAVAKTARNPGVAPAPAPAPAAGPSLFPPDNAGARENTGTTATTVVEQPAFGIGPAASEPAVQAGEPARPDADGIRAYRIGLAREARAHRQYPLLARERGWTGTAEVRVDVSREGQPRQILLARSSGHDILDREAVQMMSRAAASATLPDSLRGRAFAVRLPVVFDLDDGL